MSPYLADDALARTLALALQTVPDADLARRSARMTHYALFAPGVSAADAERLDAKAYLYELRRREAFRSREPATEPMKAAS
jgi:hypothetical protein